MSDEQKRSASVERKTKETDISVEFVIDGSGEYEIDTGIAFFDHMLESFTRHGLFDLRLTAKGDLVLCLGREEAASLGRLLRDGANDDELRQAIRDAIARKPQGHGFTAAGAHGAVPMSVTGG